MRKLFELIANLFAIIIIGVVFAKIRIKAKYFYFTLLGAVSICLGIGFGAISLAILGFEDVGGNLYRVLSKYALVFIICSVVFVYLFDRLILFLQAQILNYGAFGQLNFLQLCYSLLSGSALICYFFFVPDILGTVSMLALLIGTLVYGLKTKVE